MLVVSGGNVCGNARPGGRVGWWTTAACVYGLLVLSVRGGLVGAGDARESDDLAHLAVGASAKQPEWARAELEMFAAYREAFEAFLRRGVDERTGLLVIPVTNWGTADDLAEGIAVLGQIPVRRWR